MPVTSSYLSDKLTVHAKPQKGGYGVFAAQPVAKDEILVVWGGQIVNLEQLEQIPPERRQHSVQVDEGLYLIAYEPEPADFFNHSCNPNAGLRGQITLVALRAIEAGEEICFDYATSDGSPYDEFQCGCGASHCRGKISGDDWRNETLWQQYQGYFSPYLQRRIEALKQNRA